MLRTTLFASSFFVVVAVGISCQKPPPTVVTLGDLSDRTNNFTGKTLLVTNAGGGKRHGEYLVFPQPIMTRYHVVFFVGSADTSGCTSFSGTCSGVRVTSLPDCPCPAPFVLVSDVSAKID